MKREVSAVFNGKRPLRTRAALTALALFLIWGGGGCQNVNISSAADPALTGTVSITGEAQVGAALTASLQAAGTRTVSYQWESGESAAGEFAPIEGANDKTYTVTADDLGKYIRVTVTREGYKGGLSSAAKGPVVTLLTGTVGITGEVKVGETLTASLENEADGAFTYQWLLGGSEGGDFEPIEGAAGETYLIAPEDADKYIKVNVTREGYAGGLSSEVLGPIAPLPPLTASVSISGLRKAGAELTANFTQLEGAGTISFRWRISGSPDGDYADIEGATGETYTPVNVDVGKYIKVVVTREGYSSSVESAAKGPLLAANTTAESVEITGDDAIYRGEEESRQYTAAVNGSNPPQEIIWSIVESPASAGTFITQEGCLTVAFGETLPSITVRAASAFDETASVEKSVSIKELYWTAPANTTGINGINAIAFGNGVSAGGEGAAAKFVAGGVGGKAAYSTDGVSWTAVSDTKFGGAEITAICYGGEDANARFVAGGAGGKAAYSTDGVSWTAVSDTKLGGAEITGIAFGNVGNGTWVAVGAGGKAAYSTNGGVTWEAVIDTTFDGSNIHSVAFGNDKFVAVGGYGKAAYSPDGVSWTAVSDTKFSGHAQWDIITGIAFGNSGNDVSGKFVTVGTYGRSAYSENGVNWTGSRILQTNSITIQAITFGNEGVNARFLAVGDGGTTAYSPDGVTWTLVSDTNSALGNSIICAPAYGAGRFVAADYNRKLIVYSNLQE